MNNRLTEEWIKKIQEDFAPIVKEQRSKLYQYINSRECTKRGKVKYEKSEKGKKLRRKIDATRRRREEFDSSVKESEREMIRKFYKECPEGFHVDHIIPLGNEGEHRLFNLQWIRKEINQKKHIKMLLKKEDFPQCVIKIREGDFK